MLDAAQLAEIARLAVEHDLLVVADEVYEHLTYGVAHVPIAGFPGMRERTVTSFIVAILGSSSASIIRSTGGSLR